MRARVRPRRLHPLMKHTEIAILTRRPGANAYQCTNWNRGKMAEIEAGTKAAAQR